jgi:hypothetical protein
MCLAVSPCWADVEGAPPAAAPQKRHVVQADQPPTDSGSPTSYHGKPFSLDAAVGWQTADLTTFRSSLDARSFTANVIPTALSGPSAQLGFGARLYALTLGVRGGVAWLNGDPQGNTLELYSVDAEVGLKIPFDRLELGLLFAGGYSVMGGLSDLVHGLGSGLDIDGANARFSLGLDYYFSNQFSIGGRAAAELLFLARHGMALRDVPNQLTSVDGVQNGLLAGSGSSVGTALTFSVGPAFHF